MIDSGNATALTHVARQSRRNSHTTTSASSAPSHSMVIDEEYERSVSSTMLLTRSNSTPGCDAASASSVSCTCALTSSSSEPRLRETEKPTTDSPSSSATWLGSAAASLTVAIDDSRTARPSARLIV